MAWTFTLVAIAGLLLQLWAEIWGGNLPERSHDAKHYTRVSVAGLTGTGMIV